MQASNNGIHSGIHTFGIQVGIHPDSQGFKGIHRDSPVGIQPLSLIGEWSEAKEQNEVLHTISRRHPHYDKRRHDPGH